MSDAVQDLLDEMYFGLPGQLEHAHERPLFHRKTLHDAQAAHKANLAALEVAIERASHVPVLTATLDEVQFDRDKLKTELEQLKAKLASGQCVDLAKLTDDALGWQSVHGDKCSWSTCEARESCGDDLRQWLIEKAGVKL